MRAYKKKVYLELDRKTVFYQEASFADVLLVENHLRLAFFSLRSYFFVAGIPGLLEFLDTLSYFSV